MGGCFSKKTSLTAAVATPPPDPISKSSNIEEKKESVKKEIFVIKQRNSREERPNANTSNKENESSSSPSSSSGLANSDIAKAAAAAPVRTSSCTKEEVDAILIQCGRLSRSSSGKASAATNEGGGGRKRSYDFDHDSKKVTDGDYEEERDKWHYSHRRTPSREKDVEYKRSGSRDRSSSRDEERKRKNQNGSTSRRVSRSPGRRSETTPTPAAIDKSRPGKMVSVPASVSTASGGGAIKRVSVKRTTASPRSQSPANSHQQPPSLSRNSSRKAELSPYRRNPLNEIDDNCLRSEQIAVKHQDHQIIKNKKKPDGAAGKNQKCLTESSEVPIPKGEAVIESNKPPQSITRSKSSRRSRDLDINNLIFNHDDDKLANPTSYATLLLEDIQNFHQKNTTAFSLPPCVTKACSILDAVADLNSSEARLDHSSNNNSNTQLGKKRLEVIKDPFVETEVFVNDDLMEPSLHKYITVRRGMMEGEMEQQESSGSNSVVTQHWVSSSSWEPNSVDSTDRWNSRSNTADELVADNLPVSKKQAFSESARDVEVGTRKLRSSVTLSGRKRELDQHRQVGSRSHTTPIAAAASM